MLAVYFGNFGPFFTPPLITADVFCVRPLVKPPLVASKAGKVNKIKFWIHCATCWPINALNQTFLLFAIDFLEMFSNILMESGRDGVTLDIAYTHTGAPAAATTPGRRLGNY